MKHFNFDCGIQCSRPGERSALWCCDRWGADRLADLHPIVYCGVGTHLAATVLMLSGGPAHSTIFAEYVAPVCLLNRLSLHPQHSAVAALPWGALGDSFGSPGTSWLLTASCMSVSDIALATSDRCCVKHLFPRQLFPVRTWQGGGGSLLLSFLGVIILTFGFRLYEQRQLIAKHAPEVRQPGMHVCNLAMRSP